jgi:hypothetical protein
MKNIIQLRNGFVNLPSSKGANRYELAMSVASELMQFGYMLNQEAVMVLAKASKTDIVNFHNEVIPWLKTMTGATRSYKPFWKGFPEEVMQKSEAELWAHQFVHYITNGCYEPSEWTKARKSAFEHPKYTILGAGTEEDYLNIFTSLVSVNSSLTPDDLEAVKFFVSSGAELRFPEVIPFKENLCTLAAMGLQVPVRTVTDVLRIAVHMSGGDISLPAVPPAKIRMNRWSSATSVNPYREAFKFKKFKRAERKYLLGLLEGTNCDLREFVLKDSRWIRLGEILHPGEYASRFPKAASLFEMIRNAKVQSWYGEVDEAFKTSYRDGLLKLGERPGEFIRRFDALVRNVKKGDAQALFNVLAIVAPNASNKVLYEMMAHFTKRNVPVTNRSVMIKGARKRTSLPDLPAIKQAHVDEVEKLVKGALNAKFAKLETLGKTWIDEELKKIPLPSNMRSMSSALRPVIRGQRVPIGNEDTKVIRAYVHWFDERGSEDLDLTATLLGEPAPTNGRGKVMRIGWNGDKSTPQGCYSGDVRHRRGACAEYIDIDIKGCLKAGYKYAVLDVRNFNGGSLADLKDCVFGYMEREKPKANEIFVPATLANSVRLQSASANTIVVVIDIETREYIFLDIDQDGIPVASANLTEILDAIRPYTELPKFSVYDLLTMHAMQRGGLVFEKEEAETVLEFEPFSESYVETLKWMGV